MLSTSRKLDLQKAAEHFAQGGCCGKKPRVTSADLKVLGLIPVPETFDSSLGRIVPMSGWKAMCVWAYETLSGKTFHVEHSRSHDAGVLVARFIRSELLAERSEGGQHSG